VRRLFLAHSGLAFENFLKRIETATNDAVVEVIFQSIDVIVEQGDATLLLPYLSSFLGHVAKRQTLTNANELEILAKVAGELIPQVKSSLSENSKVFEVCKRLVLLLSDFIRVRPKRVTEDDDSRSLTLSTMIALVRGLPKDVVIFSVQPDLLPRITRLFGPWAEGNEIKSRVAREYLVDLFVLLNITKEEVAEDEEKNNHDHENELLRKMNSWIQTRVDRECDFEQRLEAYHQAVKHLELSGRVSTVLLNQALFDMQSADFALRSVAQTFASTCVRSLVNSLEFPPSLVELLSCGMRSSLKLSRDLNIRSGYMLIMREVVKVAMTLTSDDVRRQLHADLALLIDQENPDLDFFLNASHVQNSRRGRVLHRVAGHRFVPRNDSIFLNPNRPSWCVSRDIQSR